MNPTHINDAVATARGTADSSGASPRQSRTIRSVAGNAILLGALALSACASSLQLADQAWIAEDWSAAARHYADAMNDGEAAERIDDVRGRLATSRERAAASHLSFARAMRKSGDLTGALQEAETAFEFGQTDEIAEELRVLRAARAASLARDGRAALAHGDAIAAETSLERARDLDPTLDVSSDLTAARISANATRTEAFAEASDRGNAAFEARDWPVAVAQFEQALSNSEDAHVRSLLQFCQSLQAAESSAARGSWATAEMHFRSAQQLGIAPEVLEERAPYATRAPYRLTIHGAIVLPFKPGDKRQWDGRPGKEFQGARKLLAKILGVSGPSAVVYGQLADLVNTGVAPPDCFPVVTIGAREDFYGDRTVQDSCEPQWDASRQVRTSAWDGRTLSVIVWDRDIAENDPVGSWQVTLGDLAREPGVHHVILTEGGTLRGEGILALKLSLAPM